MVTAFWIKLQCHPFTVRDRWGFFIFFKVLERNERGSICSGDLFVRWMRWDSRAKKKKSSKFPVDLSLKQSSIVCPFSVCQRKEIWNPNFAPQMIPCAWFNTSSCGEVGSGSNFQQELKGICGKKWYIWGDIQLIYDCRLGHSLDYVHSPDFVLDFTLNYMYLDLFCHWFSPHLVPVYTWRKF